MAEVFGSERPRRKKTACERRAQQLRSDTRCSLRLLRGLSSLDEHRGSQLGILGTALRGVLSAGFARPQAHRPAVNEDVLLSGVWDEIPVSTFGRHPEAQGVRTDALPAEVPPPVHQARFEQEGFNVFP